MKIIRYKFNNNISYGIVDETEVVELNRDPIFGDFDTTGNRFALSDVSLLAPVIPRSKIVCVGKNYLDHAAEMNSVAPKEPLLFLKPNTSIIGPHEDIVLPKISKQVEHEAELAVVIGKIAKNIKASDALDYVFGYTIANDVTARDLQKSDGQWARAKGFDTFCPLGPLIETEFDYTSSKISLSVNGAIKQESSFRAMIHSVEEIISYASNVWTLLPGDVILTGTPAGVSKIIAGDAIEICVDGIGVLKNQVRA